MASIDRWKKDHWRARWRGPDGQSRSRVFDRKIDAQRFLSSIEHSKDTGTYVDPAAGRVHFRDYAETWRKAQPFRHGTEVAVEKDLRLHIYPVIGSRPIGAIRPSEIQAMVTGWTTQRGGNRQSKDHRRTGLAASTIQVVYGRVVAVFRAAVKDRIVTISPCVDIRLPKERSKSAIDDVLTTAQVSALAEAVPARYRAVILAGAGLGLRPGELFGLPVDRVEFLRRRVKVDQQLVRLRGEGVVVGPLKTSASYRTLPLPAQVSTEIGAHIESFGTHQELGLLFTNERGGPIQQYPYSQMFANAAVRAELPAWATPHDLRHFFASTLIRAGLSVKVVQSLLGHSSAKTTLDVYGHLFPDEEDRTRQAIEAAFSAESEDPDESGGSDTQDAPCPRVHRSAVSRVCHGDPNGA